MTETLREKTINGVLWSAIQRYGNQVITLVISIVLARLLEPRQFGLVGMLAVFVGISQTFIDSGLGTALIQKKKTTDEDFSTVFYFNLLVSIVFYFALFFTSPLIADFYGEPKLDQLTKVLGLLLIINAFGIIHNTKIQKSLEFKKIAKVTFISSILSGTIAIIFALNNFGVWSLVIYQLSIKLFKTIFLWIYDSWKPSLKFSIEAFKGLFNYSSKLLASSILHRISDSIYYVIIGKFYSPASLGFYDRAKKFQTLAARNLNATIQVVTFPVLSEIQDDSQRLHNSYKKILEMISFVIFPLMILLIVTAKPIILILIGEKWSQSIIYLQLLSVLGIGYPIASINLNILKVKGRSDLFLRLEIIKSALLIILLIITAKFGIIAIILGQYLLEVFSFYINTYYSGSFINLGPSKQLKLMLPYASISIIVALVTVSLKFLFFNNYILLLSQVALYITLYLVMTKLFKLNSFNEFIDILKSYIKKLKRGKLQ